MNPDRHQLRLGAAALAARTESADLLIARGITITVAE
jgi:hypothetical protein